MSNQALPPNMTSEEFAEFKANLDFPEDGSPLTVRTFTPLEEMPPEAQRAYFEAFEALEMSPDERRTFEELRRRILGDE